MGGVWEVAGCRRRGHAQGWEGAAGEGEFGDGGGGFVRVEKERGIERKETAGRGRAKFV